jgi:hypothetical protein
MKHYLRKATQYAKSTKLVAAFVAVAAISVLSFSSVASAAPDYFDVQKPTSRSTCDGGSWQTVHHWGWGWNWRHWGWHKYKVWTPNWEKLGFESRGQCVRYVSTSQPTSKKDCRQNWWFLGFASRSDCTRYLRLHGGGGYSGDRSEG